MDCRRISTPMTPRCTVRLVPAYRCCFVLNDADQMCRRNIRLDEVKQASVEPRIQHTHSSHCISVHYIGSCISLAEFVWDTSRHITLPLSPLLLYWWTPEWSVAILMTWCQMSLCLAFLQAVWTQKFKDWRSSSIVLSQVVLGRPTGLLQSAGGLSNDMVNGPPREPYEQGDRRNVARVTWPNPTLVNRW